MFRHLPRHGFAALVLITLTTLGLVTALLYAQPQTNPVVVTKVNNFSGISEKGSFEEALGAALQNASAMAPAGRSTQWKVTRISGLTGGAKPPSRITVTIEAHW